MFDSYIKRTVCKGHRVSVTDVWFTLNQVLGINSTLIVGMVRLVKVSNVQVGDDESTYQNIGLHTATCTALYYPICVLWISVSTITGTC